MVKYRHALASLFLALFSGCADMRNSGTELYDRLYPATVADSRAGQYGLQQESTQTRAAAISLLEGVRRYDNGNYNDAIFKFTVPEIEEAPSVFRVEAWKYTAFSYCVLERYERCRQAFDQALSIDPDFELFASEGGHPMWEAVFEKEKRRVKRGVCAYRQAVIAPGGEASTLGGPGESNYRPAQYEDCCRKVSLVQKHSILSY